MSEERPIGVGQTLKAVGLAGLLLVLLYVLLMSFNIDLFHEIRMVSNGRYAACWEQVPQDQVMRLHGYREDGDTLVFRVAPMKLSKMSAELTCTLDEGGNVQLASDTDRITIPSTRAPRE